MFSESRNDRNCRSGDRVATNRLRDLDNDNSTEIVDNAAGIGENSAEIGDDVAGIVDIAAKVIPCQTLSWMETRVTLFLEDNFQRGLYL